MSARSIKRKKGLTADSTTLEAADERYVNLATLDNYILRRIGSYLTNLDLMNLRSMSRRLKDLCDFMLTQYTKKITICGSEVMGADFEKKTLMKAEMYSKAKKLVIQSPDAHIEGIVCMAKRHLSIDSLNVTSGKEDRIDDLTSISHHIPLLKKLTFVAVFIKDGDMALLFESLKNLESFKAYHIHIDYADELQCLNHIGTNLKTIKWVTFPVYGTQWMVDIHSVATENNLTMISLNEKDYSITNDHNVVDFLSEALPNLVSLRLYNHEIDTLHGLNSLSHLRNLFIDTIWITPPLLQTPNYNIKKLVLVTITEVAVYALVLFPSLEELVLNQTKQKGSFHYTSEVISALRDLKELKSFTSICFKIKLSEFQSFVDTVDEIHFVHKLTFAFTEQLRSDKILDKMIKVAEDNPDQHFVFVTPRKSTCHKPVSNVSLIFSTNMAKEVKRLQRFE